MTSFIKGVGDSIDTFESDGTSLPNLDSISDIFILKGNNDNDDGVYFVVEDNGIKSMVYQGGLNTSTTTPSESSGYDITTTETLTGNKLEGEDTYIKKINGVSYFDRFSQNGVTLWEVNQPIVIPDIDKIVTSKLIYKTRVYPEFTSEGDFYYIKTGFRVESDNTSNIVGVINPSDDKIYTDENYTTLANNDAGNPFQTLTPVFTGETSHSFVYNFDNISTKIGMPIGSEWLGNYEHYFIVEYTKTT